ncbi:uncharacterized protein JCM15063_006322 [Sporobolomyces koalae]|uniref:uncharacterized protein n=1 Tax=Sporobolomyces koalae TaxID=500713 RepID=UPI0031772DA5
MANSPSAFLQEIRTIPQLALFPCLHVHPSGEVARSKERRTVGRLDSLDRWDRATFESREGITSEDAVGEWKIGRDLGKGTSGIVYLGRSIKSGAIAAVKKVKRLPPEHREAGLVHREIALMKLVSPHPHIVELLDVYESELNLYLVTEYCSRGELFKYVTVNVLSSNQVFRFYSQLVSVLLHLSSLSITHRDIKFENLLLFEDQDRQLSIKVADFGMATFQPEGTMLYTSCGSPHYAAPEVIAGGPYVGTLADIWSSGVCLFAMIARRLPFDDLDIPILLDKVKGGKYEMDTSIRGWARDLVTKSLKSDVKERITLEQILEHPYLATKSSSLLQESPQLVKPRMGESQGSMENFENLSIPVLASLAIVLKCSTIAEVKVMLEQDENRARYFYSKLLYFRSSKLPQLQVKPPTRPSTANRNLSYDDNDQESFEISASTLDLPSSSLFPAPPAARDTPLKSQSVVDELSTVRDAYLSTIPARAAVLDPEVLFKLGQAQPDDAHHLHSAPPQTQTFPAYFKCLHELGPLASAPPQMESFLTEPMPVSSRVLVEISRRNSVAHSNAPLSFLDLDLSPTSHDAFSFGDTSSNALIRCSSLITEEDEVRRRKKKQSLHQRIRSLLTGSAGGFDGVPLPPVVSRVTNIPINSRARPPSPTPSNATSASRLTRSNATRSLGRFLLAKSRPRSPLLPVSTSTAELTDAQRIVVDMASQSPGISSTTDSKCTEGESPQTGGVEATIVKKTTLKKRLSILQFFHDDDAVSTVSETSIGSPATKPSKSVKEKRRPTALTISASNLVAVDAKIAPKPPKLVKRLSILGIGSSYVSALAPSSPLMLDRPTPAKTASNSPQEESEDHPVSFVEALNAYPLRSSLKSSRSSNPVFPVHATPPPLLPPIPRRSTLSSTLSIPLADISSGSEESTASVSVELSQVRVQYNKLVLENQLLRSTLDSKDKEIELLRERELEMRRTVREMVENNQQDEIPFKRENSKTSFMDEDV